MVLQGSLVTLRVYTKDSRGHLQPLFVPSVTEGPSCLGHANVERPAERAAAPASLGLQNVRRREQSNGNYHVTFVYLPLNARSRADVGQNWRRC